MNEINSNLELNKEHERELEHERKLQMQNQRVMPSINQPLYPSYMTYRDFSVLNDLPALSNSSVAENENVNINSNNNCNSMIKNLLKTHSLLERYIGNTMKVDFLIGSNLDTKVGELVAVGENYIALKISGQRTIIVCDSSCVKFVTIILED